jgi:N-hydroxyarylamine O-acetyltransferase
MNRQQIAEKYLDTLGLVKVNPDLDFLSSLTAHHVAMFPFSSLGCQLGDELPLDLESLFSRIVVKRRGGYCFEQNGLFFEILQELGYAVQLYLARVIVNGHPHPGLTHRISVVTLDELEYVGFGAFGPRLPVLISAQETVDGSKRFRIAQQRTTDFHMQVFKDGAFLSLYRFERARYGQADCEVGHFFSHKHPDATFVNNLTASLIKADEIRSLRNFEYWVIMASGTVAEEIDSAEKLTQILTDSFHLAVSESEGRQLYNRLSQKLST